MESRIELLDEECLLSRAPNLEANKFAMLSVPDAHFSNKRVMRELRIVSCPGAGFG